MLIRSQVGKHFTITMANGFCVSVPTPVANAAGDSAAINAVIMMGRSRSTAPSRMA